MSYGDFTLETLRHQFGMTVQDQVLFDPVGDLIPSPWLRQSLQYGMKSYLLTEKARSEFIVAPILLECRDQLERRINIFSGIALDADREAGLTGQCDFILARSESKYDLQWPIMLVVEAKKHDIALGLGPCAAQMMGACRYNDRDGKRLPYVYGCVTTGELWQFLKLEGTTLTFHPERFLTKEISKILWFAVECLKDMDQQASDAA